MAPQRFFGSQLLKGTTPLLVLTVIGEGQLYGYEIAQKIRERSGGAFAPSEGSLYPALHRLEQAGLITSTWRTSETSRRARFYQLTAQGRRELKSEEENWEAVTGAVTRVLQFT